MDINQLLACFPTFVINISGKESVKPLKKVGTWLIEKWVKWST